MTNKFSWSITWVQWLFYIRRNISSKFHDHFTYYLLKSRLWVEKEEKERKISIQYHWYPLRIVFAMKDGVSSGTLKSELVSEINFGASQTLKPIIITQAIIINNLYFLRKLEYFSTNFIWTPCQITIFLDKSRFKTSYPSKGKGMFYEQTYKMKNPKTNF